MNSRTLVMLLLLAIVQGVGGGAIGQDNPPADQDPGEHSTMCTSNGPIRDDELAKMISDAIKNSGNTPSSVKVFFNSCYGGGMLDDIANALGPPNFQTPIPFIGASASDGDQPAWGPDDAWSTATGNGSFWTNGLADAVTGASPGQSVSGTVGTANANDPVAPGGKWVGILPKDGDPENPQNTSDHGGSAVNWSTGAEVVVFGGNNTNPRHGNNVSKMEDAFNDMWGGDANSNIQSTGGNPNGSGSTQDLQNMITTACNNINPGEELVIYIDDHGNTEFDFDEWWDHYLDEMMGEDDHLIELTSTTTWESIVTGLEGSILPSLHDGWEAGLTGNLLQGDEVDPGLIIELPDDWSGDFPAESFFDVFFKVFFDGVLLGEFFPALGDAFLPIPHDPAAPLLTGGEHLLSFVPGAGSPPFDPFPLGNLELTSGPINDLTVFIPEPSTAVLLLLAMVFFALRRRSGR